MKQKILKLASSALFLPLMLGALTGCPHRVAKDGPHPAAPQTGYQLRLIVHGPFAVVLNEHGATALVPRDKEGQHETISPYPYPHAPHSMPKGCKVTTQFELIGVESADKTTIDPAFAPVTFPLDDWKHSRGKADLFVTMNLPLPHSVDALGPPYQVYFAQKPTKPELVPLTQVLEFMVRDMKNVQLVRTETCGTGKHSSKKENLLPLPCHVMQEKYQDYFEDVEDPYKQESQRPYLKHEFERCTDNTSFLFVGVGLHPKSFPGLDPHERGERFADSGRDFFNNELLPLVYGSADKVPSDKKLVPPPKVPPECRDYCWQSWSVPRLTPAAYRIRETLPPFLMFASTENCTSPSVILR